MPNTQELMRSAAAIHGINPENFSEPTSGNLSVNGINLHYVDWGGDGQPVLFLHGGAQTCRTWDMVCLQLRSHYRCYALDQRSHGDSDGDGGVNFADQHEDLRSTVDALGLTHYALVGMSMGGINSMAFAATQPAGLDSLTVVDITPTPQPGGAVAIGAFSSPQEFNSLEQALDKAKSFNPNRPAAHLHYSLIHSLRQRNDGKFVWKHQRSAGHAPQIAEANEEPNNRAHMTGLWDEVGHINTPALIVHGHDSKVTHFADAQRLAKAIPRGEMISIDGAGHTVQGDQPVKFARALTHFLDRSES